MKTIIKIFIFLTLFNTYQNNLIAEVPHYIDFKFILNQSISGKKAQLELKQKLENGIKKFRKRKKFTKRRKKIIQQKKIISPEEYKKR